MAPRCTGRSPAALRVAAVLLLGGALGCNRSARSPEQLFRRAQLTLNTGDVVTSLRETDTAFRRFEGHDEKWAWRFRVLKAEVLLRQGQNNAVLALLREQLPSSLASDEVAVRREVALARAGIHLQDYDAAAAHLATARGLPASTQPEMEAQIALEQGLLLYYRGDFDNAESSLKQALLISRSQKFASLEGNALLDLGETLRAQQQFEEAIAAYKTAQKAYEAAGDSSHDSGLLGNLGESYFALGDYDSALEMVTQAEQSAAQLGRDFGRIYWLSDIGRIDAARQNYLAAARSLESALAIARKIQEKSQISLCLTELASVELKSGAIGDAEQHTRESLALTRSIQDRSGELHSLLNQAGIAFARGHYAEAETTLQGVIRSAGNDAYLRWSAETLLARVYASENEPAQADGEFRQAMAVVDSARSTLAEEEHRLSFLTSALDFYDDYIEFLIAGGRARDALALAEHARARTLEEGLGLLAGGKQAKIGQKAVAETAAMASPPHRGAAFRPEETARKLNAVILSYWLTPQRSYLWAITPSRLALFSLPPERELNALAGAYAKELSSPHDVFKTADRSGRKLYDLLIAPAQKLIPEGGHVIVIPDGELNALNFETLLVPLPQLHFWIDDVAISDSNSIALLAAENGRGRNEGKRMRRGITIVAHSSNPPLSRSLLLIGDPVSPSPEFPALPQARLELQRVGQHFGAGERLVIAREQATPPVYAASHPGEFDYIHFVAHATASRLKPLDSGVILTAAGDNYKLYARDIMQQPLRAELVTLSACYSAGARAYTGEGLVGLSWAFLRAGAHHVIASLWRVDDVSTPQLMDMLYAEMDRGSDPVTALRVAKLRMLHSDSIYRMPFYWAPFQVYQGD